MIEEFLSLLQEEYLEKLYFFVLKKTGNRHDAEDLSQDIITEAILSLTQWKCSPRIR